jgi:molecular chaperone DnaK
MARAAGIDLGTTNSVIAIIRPDGTPEVLTNAEGGRLTPSAVAFTADGETVVGDVARRQLGINPAETVLSVKRKMGTRERVHLGNEELLPEQVSAMILRKLVDDASATLGDKITKAVITVPAYFDDRQRTATKRAGEIAGLEVLRIINEPTSAALAYGMDRRDTRNIVVYDLGGGTFDVSVLTVGNGLCEVQSTAGDTKLGGDDFDREIVNWILAEMKPKVDLSKDVVACGRILEAAERAKRELSSVSVAPINIPFIALGEFGPIHVDLKLSLAAFEEMIFPWIDRTLSRVEQAMIDANMGIEDIDEVLLVGGSTRVPAVRSALATRFGRTPSKSLNPDEVVAIGAAVNAGIIEGVVEGVVLADVTPLTLSVETKGGVANAMIRRNSTIPVTRKEIFSTALDMQDSVPVHVVQGERPMAAENRTLGRFSLEGILPAPAGVPKIEVSFDIDVDGILSVSAKDLATGLETSVIMNESDLDDETVQKMVEEAFTHAEEDRHRKKLIETRNGAEAIIAHARSILRDNAERLDVEMTEEVEDAISGVEGLLDADNPGAIEQGGEELKKVMMGVGERLYQSVEVKKARGE